MLKKLKHFFIKKFNKEFMAQSQAVLAKMKLYLHPSLLNTAKVEIRTRQK